MRGMFLAIPLQALSPGADLRSPFLRLCASAVLLWRLSSCCDLLSGRIEPSAFTRPMLSEPPDFEFLARMAEHRKPLFKKITEEGHAEKIARSALIVCAGSLCTKHRAEASRTTATC